VERLGVLNADLLAEHARAGAHPLRHALSPYLAGVRQNRRDFELHRRCNVDIVVRVVRGEEVDVVDTMLGQAMRQLLGIVHVVARGGDGVKRGLTNGPVVGMNLVALPGIEG
jgi:hypothetical protein